MGKEEEGKEERFYADNFLRGAARSCMRCEPKWWLEGQPSKKNWHGGMLSA